jgi:hypothetical protein
MNVCLVQTIVFFVYLNSSYLGKFVLSVKRDILSTNPVNVSVKKLIYLKNFLKNFINKKFKEF